MRLKIIRWNHNISKKIDKKDLKQRFNFQQFETIRTFCGSISNGKIMLVEANR